MIYINIRNGCKAFNDNLVFDKINLKINKPGLYFVVGTSGCGKSTLLNIIAGIDKLTKGNIETKGSITTIFQNYELIDELSILENIFLKKKKDITKEEYSLISNLGINEYLNRSIKELSFGQRQRVGIARALSLKPAIVLCDEPTESLDISNKLIVMDTLKEYSKDHIVLLISHDQILIDKYADNIFEFKNKELVVTKTSNNTDNNNFCDTSLSKLSIASLSFKMSIKRLMVILSFIIVGLSSLWCLYSLKKQTFDIPSSTYTLGADYIYINSNKPLDLVKKDYSIKSVMIYDIPSLELNGEHMRMDIYPYHENDEIKIDGSKPKNGIIINQHVEAEIGDKVTLSVRSPIGIINYDTYVEGIALEKDSTFRAAYYNFDSVTDFLKKYDIEEENNFIRYSNVYDLIFDNPTLYEAEVGYDKVSAYINKVGVSNSLYELRQLLHDDVPLYEFIFNGVLLIFVIFILAIIIIFNYFDINHFMYQASILSSVGVKISKLKALYVFYHYSMVFISLLIVLFICYLVKAHVFVDVSYSQLEYLWAILSLVLVYLYYITVSLIFLLNFKKKRIALILKKKEL